MNLKILQLPKWSTSFRAEDTLKHYKEIAPVYNRNGLYKIGKIQWIEVNGKAYQNDGYDFGGWSEAFYVPMTAAQTQQSLDAFIKLLPNGLDNKLKKAVIENFRHLQQLEYMYGLTARLRRYQDLKSFRKRIAEFKKISLLPSICSDPYIPK